MKTLILFTGLLVLLGGCKREEPKPQMTEVRTSIVDEIRQPLENIDVAISGSTGSYFGGTRRDTLFAQFWSSKEGEDTHKTYIDPKWRVYVSVNGFPYYELVKFEGTIDGIVNVGQVNNITVIMRKR